MKGEEEVDRWISQFIQELKTTMFLIGASNIEELKDAEVIISGKLAQWMDERAL